MIGSFIKELKFMTRTLFFIVLLLFILIIETYTYHGLKCAFPQGRKKVIVFIIYAISIFVIVTGIISMGFYLSARTTNMGYWHNLLIGITFTLIITKIIFAGTLFLSDSFRIIKFCFQKISSWFSNNSDPVEIEGRRKFITQIGIGIAAIPFTGLLYGIIKGKYDFKIHRQSLNFPDLPIAFDKLKIVQISDFHSGSFDNIESVARGLKMVQDQNPDLIFFTGDLVNNFAQEIEPYMHLLKDLHAPMGKFAILGNHDYGEYVNWESEEEKLKNTESIKLHLVEMGFSVLNNQRTSLIKNNEQIQIVGVENWGKPPFPSYGDLNKALEGINKEDFTILLSHDPDHWEEKTLPHPKNINLTLSGHTHGMQMGIEIPGFKWSPVKYRYKKWAGLYQQNGQYLYVNRGFGYLGYPGRIGIWPEITVIELKSDFS